VRRILALTTLGALATLLAAAACKWRESGPRGYPGVGVYESHVALEKEPETAVLSFDRAANPVVVYRVTLTGAPSGRALPMTCSWLDPSGKVAHENAWTTKKVSHDVWPTHCRCPLGSAAPPGTWKVEMSVDGRLLKSSAFEVR